MHYLSWIYLVFELVPVWVFLVELFAVVGKENDGEYCEKDAPEGTPETDHVHECAEGDSIVDGDRCQLEVKSQGIHLRIVVVHYRHLLEYRLNLQSFYFLSSKTEEIIRQYLVADYLKVYVDALVEFWNHKKVVKKIIIAVCSWFLQRNRGLVDFVLNKKEEAAVVGQIGHVILLKTILSAGVVGAEKYLYTHVFVLV